MINIKKCLLAASLGVALWASDAGANVLWMGSDGFVDFAQIGSTGSCNNSFVTGTGRSAVGVSAMNGTSTTDPPANRAQTSTFAAAGALWVHATIRDGNGASTSNEQALILRSPDGVARIIVRQTGTFGILKLSTRDHLGAFVDVATATTPALAANTLTAFDLHVDYAGGAAQLYLGTSNKVIDFSGSLETDSATTLNQLELMSVSQATAVNQALADCTSRTAWSEIIVTDTDDTRGMILMPLTPQANGTTQQCTSGTAGNLTDSSDSTVVSSATNNQICGFTTLTTFPSGTWNVLAVGQTIRASRSNIGPQDLDFYNRTADGTDHLAGTTTNPSLAPSNFNWVWLTNPHTSSAWQQSDITTGFNLGFKSLP